MSQDTASPQPYLDRLQRRALVVGIIGLVLCALGVWLNPVQFFRSYLLAYVFWLGLALGCMAVLMVHHLAGGTWGALLRRVLESGMRTLPLMVVLFIPLLFGLRDLYSWARPEVVANDEVLRHKSPYLNVPFFGVRLAVYFVSWLALAYLLNRWSRQEEQAPGVSARDPIHRRLALFSGLGLLLYGLTMTFAAVDWVMSLEPHWYSTIYGILILVGQLVAALSFGVVALALLAGFEPLSEVLSPEHLHDLGNLLLTSVLFWAYIAFSQFLIIWAGNLPEGIAWYVHRSRGGWQWVGVALALFQFALPFMLLLSRDIKEVPRRLGMIAAVIFCMHFVDVFWIVMPAFYREGPDLHWLDLVAPIGVGGVWMAVFAWQLKGKSLLPVHDLALQGAIDRG
jgi:hypothetical protein